MSLRSYRACMVCAIVQPGGKFNSQGCPNCEDVLELRGNSDAIQDCTSQVYEGLITLAQPQSSWVAKWQGFTNYVPGVYAVKVVGSLPEEVLDALEAAGITYHPRDGSAGDGDGEK